MSTAALVLVYPRDMLSGSQALERARRAGAQVAVDRPPEQVTERPACVIVEMGPVSDTRWQDIIREVRRRWPDVPILAFGPHVDVAARQRARTLGATLVLSRHRFHDEGTALIASYLARGEDHTGCNAPLDALGRRGVDLFNAGDYYECHEVLEEAWRAEQRPCRALYQGLLQFGIALYHIQRGHYPGAYKMLLRAERHLRDLPDRCRGLDVAALREHVRRVKETLVALGPKRVHEFPRDLFPRLAYETST